MKKILCLIVVIVSIPSLVINFFYTYDVKDILSGFILNKKDVKVRVLKSDNKVDCINLEDYLVGVVSGEVPVYFENEALKAQAVAARTYALKQIENNKEKEYDVTDTVSSQVYKTEDDLKNRWGSDYEKNIKKIKNAVKSTEGEYVSYNNDPIYAFFFSTSNGYTEDNKNVFGQDLPYLKTVDSSFDEKETSNFIVTKEYSLNDFYNKLNIPYSESLTITDEEKSNAGRVLNLKVNGNLMNGRDFQSKLKLRSTDFTVEKIEDKVKITTKGFGHGVGMSQYGANALAKQNKTYEEILKYYYTGTNLQKL